MSKTNEQVAHLFAHRQAGDSNNLHSDGRVLRSYRTPIAVWYGDTCFVSSDNMSPTTASKHLSPLWSALNYKYFLTPAFGYYDRGEPSVERCIVAAAEEMPEALKTLCRARVDLESRTERYTERRQQIIDTAALFNVTIPEMPEITGDLKVKAAEMRARDAEKRRQEAQRQEERERAQQIIDAGAFGLWLTQGRGHFPSSYQERDNDRITVKAGYVLGADKVYVRNPAADTIITSQGAQAPLAHVVKALAFYDSRMIRREIGSTHNYVVTCTPYRTNGHKIPLGAFVLDSIDEQGNVTAGCHTFTAQEIARFRKQWGL